MFYHESRLSDICSFRAVNVAITVSFKLMSFFTFIVKMAESLSVPEIRSKFVHGFECLEHKHKSNVNMTFYVVRCKRLLKGL